MNQECIGCANLRAGGVCEVLTEKPAGKCWARATFADLAQRYADMAKYTQSREAQLRYERLAKQYRKMAKFKVS